VINPRVAVSVISYRPFYILGEVNKPGAYPYTSNMTAMTAIALAGGHTTKAVTSTLYIQRQGQTAEREYPADQRTKIYPGDVVRIPDTVFWRIMSYALPLTAVRPY
jgi:polysaccharide export outer membrane protein